jgi:hypothetical protein
MKLNKSQQAIHMHARSAQGQNYHQNHRGNEYVSKVSVGTYGDSRLSLLRRPSVDFSRHFPELAVATKTCHYPFGLISVPIGLFFIRLPPHI